MGSNVAGENRRRINSVVPWAGENICRPCRRWYPSAALPRQAAAKSAYVGQGEVNGIEVAGGAEVSHLLEIGKALRGVRGCSSLNIHLFQHFGSGLRVAL